MAEHALTVTCDHRGDAYQCVVRVGDDSGATRHEVAFEQSELDRLAPDGTTPDALVRAAFSYLLEQEPREQILRQFELDVIGRYYPGWQDAVRQRLR